MTLSLWGFAGYLLLYLAVITGTAVSSPWLRRHLPMVVRSNGTHTILSLAGLVATAVHTLKSVASPQGDEFAPLAFLGSAAPLDPALALGVAGLYAFLVSTAVVYFRHALAGPVWRIAHALAYPAFAAAAWHGVALGANTWLPEAQVMYGVTFASAATLAAVRLVEMSIRLDRGRRAPARTR